MKLTDNELAIMDNVMEGNTNANVSILRSRVLEEIESRKPQPLSAIDFQKRLDDAIGGKVRVQHKDLFYYVTDVSSDGEIIDIITGDEV